jgi:DNA-binding NarL/FixJ family response regulator
MNLRKKLTVLLVDDHPLTLIGLRLTLENGELPFETLEIQEATGVNQALELINITPPEIAIIDLNLMDGHGIRLACQLKQIVPEIKILFYTGSAQIMSQTELLEAGGHGFLHKSREPALLSQALMSIYFGGYYFGSTSPAELLSETKISATVKLSLREMQVLRMLAEDYSKDNIAFHLGISVRTVETYRSRLMKKLGIRSNVGLIRYAIEHGIIELLS